MLLVIGLATIIIIYLLWRFSKTRLETISKKEMDVTIIREPIMTPAIAKSDEVPWSYSMDTNIVREAYRSFESKANEFGLPRLHDETVREWFHRQKWVADNRFFLIYDSVRYGQNQMNAEDGEWFIAQLDVLSKKYFSEKV